MKVICRTCLNPVRRGLRYYPLGSDNTSSVRDASIRQMLEACVPELTLDVVKDAVLCSQCADELRSAYNYKKKCIETEDYIYKYIMHTDINNTCIDITLAANWLSQQGANGIDSGLPTEVINITDDEEDSDMEIISTETPNPNPILIDCCYDDGQKSNIAVQKSDSNESVATYNYNGESKDDTCPELCHDIIVITSELANNEVVSEEQATRHSNPLLSNILMQSNAAAKVAINNNNNNKVFDGNKNMKYFTPAYEQNGFNNHVARRSNRRLGIKQALQCSQVNPSEISNSLMGITKGNAELLSRISPATNIQKQPSTADAQKSTKSPMDGCLDDGSQEMPVLEHCGASGVENFLENAEMPQLQPIDHLKTYEQQFVTYVRNKAIPPNEPLNKVDANKKIHKPSTYTIYNNRTSASGNMHNEVRQQHAVPAGLPLFQCKQGQIRLDPFRAHYYKFSRLKCCKCKTIVSTHTHNHLKSHGVSRMKCVWCLFSTDVKDIFFKHYLKDHIKSEMYVCVCKRRKSIQCPFLSDLLVNEEHSYADDHHSD